MTDNAVRVDAPIEQTRTEPTSLTIGVTGHRPTRLRDADLPLLRERVREVLITLQTAIPGGTISVLSPLAEGADQTVARVALDTGCKLACALPFARDAYASDFATAAAKAEYRALLALAERVVELGGSRTTPEERDLAYAAVGSYTIAHSDALLAIWDGEQARGNGGTGQVVAAAFDARVPVIWIPAARPHTTRVLIPGQHSEIVEAPLASAGHLVHDRIMKR